MKNFALPFLMGVSLSLLPAFAADAKSKRAKPEATGKENVHYTIEKDIVYAKYGTRDVLLDLYRPKEPSAAAIPCIVVVHGGGWRSGDKQRFARHAAYLANAGFAVACIGYRLLPEVGVPQCIEDAKAAVRWVRANASRYGIDPDRIGAFGGSAGAHLVAMLGTSYKVAKLEGTGGNAGVSSRVQAVVAMAAPTDFSVFQGRTEMDKPTAALISPVTYVDKDSAPLLLLHGDADKTVPMEQSEIIVARYGAVGASAELVKMKGPHGFWNQDLFDDTMARSVAFYREKLK